MRKKITLLVILFLIIFPLTVFSYWKDTKRITIHGRTGKCKIYVTPIVISAENVYPSWTKTYKIIVRNVGTTRVRLRAILRNIPGYLRVSAWFGKYVLYPNETTYLYIRILMPALQIDYQNTHFNFHCIIEGRQF